MSQSLRLVLVLTSLASTGAVLAGPPIHVRDALRAGFREDSERLVGLYKQLHSQPELSFQEKKTAARIAEELRAAGCEVTENVGGHGLVGILRNGDGPVVLARTDLDGLPIKEETGVPWASQATATDDRGNQVPVMHACGHDVHMTVFVGAARALQRLREHWRGTVVFLGQPAEERGSGARKMLADGLFERFPRPTAAVALHVSATLPAGTVGWTEGFALANVDTMDVTFRGVGGHGAYPHTAKDPIVLAAQAVLAFQTIVSRETEPGQAAVVTVGSIHGGTKHNVIPDEVKLQLTLRSYTEEVRQHTIEAIRRISRGLAEAAGIPAERHPTVELSDGFTPALFNDPSLTAKLRAAVGGWIGEEKLRSARPVMGGEDFSEYGRTAHKIPICMLWLGVVETARVEESERTRVPLPSLHSSKFHPVLDPSLATGVEAMTGMVIELLGGK